MIASQKKWPLRFRLPTVEEWKSAYTYGGGDKEGWLVHNSGGNAHPVAELAANDAHLYDMKGNVSEMCSDIQYLTTDDDSILTLTAVVGNNYQESPTTWGQMPYIGWICLLKSCGWIPTCC